MLDTVQSKICTKCKKEKLASEFTFLASGRDGLHPNCKSCRRVDAKAYHARSEVKVAMRDYWVERKYGITREQYRQMLDAQCGVCKLCGLHETEKHNGEIISLSIDHDHSDGRIRGLVCKRCNQLIRYLEDDIALTYRTLEHIKGF